MSKKERKPSVWAKKKTRQSEHVAWTPADDQTEDTSQTVIPLRLVHGRSLGSKSKSKDKSHSASKLAGKIGVAGIRTIFDSQAHPARRICWSLLLAAGCVVTAIQMAERIDYYTSLPVRVEMGIEFNESLPAPVFTMCAAEWKTGVALDMARNAWNELQEQEKQLLERPDFEGMVVEELWQRVESRVMDMIKSCTIGAKNALCHEVGKWDPVATALGVCFTYHLAAEVLKVSGMHQSITLTMQASVEELRREGVHGWKYLIHGRKDTPAVDIETHGLVLRRGWTKSVELHVTKHKAPNRPSQPCEENPGYSKSQCLHECFSRYMVSLVECRLPSVKKVTDHMPSCRGMAQHERAQRALDRLLKLNYMDKANCSCLPPCEYISVVAVNSFTEPRTDSEDENLAVLKLYYKDLNYEYIEEVFHYSMFRLLAHIGAILSLILGASLLTFFEIAEVLIKFKLRMFLALNRRRKSKPHKKYRFEARLV